MRLGWVVLPYLAVFVGMILLRSAWGALIAFHLALLPVLFIRRRDLSLRSFAPVSLGLLLPVAVVGLSAGLGLYFIWPHVGLDGLPVDYPAQVAKLGLSDAFWLPFITYFALVNPWLEEIYWRAALTSPSPYPAPVDFLFAGYHLFILVLFVNLAWMFLAFLILAGAGWLWRQVSRYTGSLLPAFLSHLLADLSILLVLYFKT